jgi:23S rRNA G2445 N2-methylase RlmL
MADKKDICPFCGSETLMIETPFMVLNNKGEYERKKQPCCRSSAQNQKWIQKHENPITHEKPKMKDIIKW